MEPTRVILWSEPRCLSTAFERSIRTLSDGEVIHEPFSPPYGVGPERQSDRYLSYSPFMPGATYQSAVDEITKPVSGKKFVFVKDQPMACKNNFQLFLRDELRDFKHSFLIRNPAQSIPSFYKTPVYHPDEVGFKELLDLCGFVEKHLHPSPVVVDADDLLDFPDEVMKGYCAAVGIGYEEGMTQWEPGTFDAWEWPICRTWHENVINSSGFIRKKRRNEMAPDIQPEVADIVKSCMPYYEVLYSKRLQIEK